MTNEQFRETATRILLALIEARGPDGFRKENFREAVRFALDAATELDESLGPLTPEEAATCDCLGACIDQHDIDDCPGRIRKEESDE